MENKKLLVVDDDPGLRELLQEYLATQGYEVVAVADGMAMELHLQQHTVNLVILDLMLPGEDGLSLARKLRAGSVWVNYWDGGDMTAPFGGYKQSGNGRDKSLHAFEKYTEVKATWINLAP